MATDHVFTEQSMSNISIEIILGARGIYTISDLCPHVAFLSHVVIAFAVMSCNSEHIHGEGTLSEPNSAQLCLNKHV